MEKAFKAPKHCKKVLKETTENNSQYSRNLQTATALEGSIKTTKRSLYKSNQGPVIYVIFNRYVLVIGPYKLSLIQHLKAQRIHVLKTLHGKIHRGINQQNYKKRKTAMALTAILPLRPSCTFFCLLPRYHRV